MRQGMSGLEPGMTRPGFSLIELVVAIGLLVLVAAVVVPRLGMRNPKQEREQFIAQLNGLTKFAWQNAITSRKTHQIDFDLQKKVVTILQDSGAEKKDGKLQTVPLQKSHERTSIKIPPQLLVKNFYIEGFDEMTSRTGKEITGAYFYIIPEGLTQSVIINIVDTKERIVGRGKEIGLVLNPFSAQFKVYGTFKQP